MALMTRAWGAALSYLMASFDLTHVGQWRTARRLALGVDPRVASVARSLGQTPHGLRFDCVDEDAIHGTVPPAWGFRLSRSLTSSGLGG